MIKHLLNLYQNYLNAVKRTIPLAIKGRNRTQSNLTLNTLIHKIQGSIKRIEHWEAQNYSIQKVDIQSLKNELWHRYHPEEFLPRTEAVKQARIRIYEYFKELEEKLK